jgi:selenocysteine lyase/cysteine desulfurase
MSDASFVELPQRLRAALAALVGGHPDQIVLGNSASWGLQVIANAFPWQDGDAVSLVASDYPASIHPWLVLERRGVRIRRVGRPGSMPDEDEIAASLTPETRVLCVTWVDSYSGRRLDMATLAESCGRRGTFLVVNVTQGLGALPLDVAQSGIDALSASGFKWLLGPYATGFAWIAPPLLEILNPVQSYWLAEPDDIALDLGAVHEPRLRDDLGARAFDIFGTANFFNFAPWLASVEYLLSIGLERIAEHDGALVQRLLEGVDTARYQVVTPQAPSERAAIVALRPLTMPAELGVAELGRRQFDVALRAGHLRISPHLYNTPKDIDALLEALDEIGPP